IERVRFTSPHPAAFTDDVIAAMAETPTVMPQLHMPLQSGSDRVLRAMRRSYRSDTFLGILERVRAAMPEAAITSDIIVGFPGETEEDFAATLRVVEQARFSSAFTFQYSPRPGTPAADLSDQVPKAVVQERYGRLAALQDRIALEENAAQVGRTVEVLIAEGEGRKDGSSQRISGRAADNRLVHVGLPDEGHVGGLTIDVPDADGADRARSGGPRPGDLVTVDVTHGAPHYLVADSGVQGGRFTVRRTRAGDAWEARERARLAGDDHDHGHTGAGGAIALGMPRRRS
ncbi:MAG: radical SAM protein, partial [Cellulomonas sp.]